MAGRFNFFQGLNKDRFTPYGRRENSFERLAPLYLLFAFVVAPIFTLLIYFSTIPEEYFIIGISFTVGFFIYVVLCWLIKPLRKKLLYFFLFHLTASTLYAFYGLYVSEFATINLFCFLAAYSLFALAIQRLYPLLLYNILVLLLIIYGLYTIPETSISKSIVLAFFVLIGLSSTFMIYSRQIMLNSVEDYTEYLKDILDDPVMGYLLLSTGKRKQVIDINPELKNKIFGAREMVEIPSELLSWFDDKEKDKIDELKLGRSIKKRIDTVVDGRSCVYEIKVSILQLKNGDGLLFRFNDITAIVEKNSELEISEKRYRNLFYRNRSGVFTVDSSSKIIDANPAFYEMLDHTLHPGDILFEQQDDWNYIKDSISANETFKKFQTQYTLKNGKVKTFVFSWYKDEYSDNYEGSLIDLTTFEKASQALKQSEEKYRLIFEESNDAILLIDGDIVVNANQKALQLFPDVLNKKLFTFSSDRSATSEKKYYKYKSRLASEPTVKFEWIFNERPDTIQAEVTLTEIILEDKIFYQCVIHDQTEMNKILRNIESSRKNLENILNNSPDAILIARENEILYSNPELKRMFGEEANFDDIFKGPDSKKIKQLFSLYHKEKRRQSSQVVLNGGEKDQMEVDITIVPTQYQDKEADLILIRDISVQNAFIKEKARAEMAEEANKQLEAEIEQKIEAQRLLQEQYLRTKAILESSSNTFLLTLLPDRSIRTFNTQFKNYFRRLSDNEIREDVLLDFFLVPILSKKELRYFNRVIQKVVNGKQRQLEVQLNANDRKYWLEIYMSPIYDTMGNVSEISLVAHDISEKKKANIKIIESLREKEVLLKEIHHRVKNNLQVISSILNLQSSYVTDDNTLKILQESRNRIRSMAIIHENLYRREDFSTINFAAYLENLTGNLISSYGIYQQVDLVENLENVDLDLDQAIPCGLLVNEVISNSLKYAWDENERGIIYLSLKKEGKMIILEIGDNGKGLPEEFNKIKSDTLGLQLIITLVEQLDGDLEVDNKNGTKYLIKFEDIKPNSHVKD